MSVEVLRCECLVRSKGQIGFCLSCAVLTKKSRWLLCAGTLRSLSSRPAFNWCDSSGPKIRFRLVTTGFRHNFIVCEPTVFANCIFYSHNFVTELKPGFDKDNTARCQTTCRCVCSAAASPYRESRSKSAIKSSDVIIMSNLDVWWDDVRIQQKAEPPHFISIQTCDIIVAGGRSTSTYCTHDGTSSCSWNLQHLSSLNIIQSQIVYRLPGMISPGAVTDKHIRNLPCNASPLSAEVSIIMTVIGAWVCD